MFGKKEEGDPVYSGLTHTEVQQILQQAGYRAVVEQGSQAPFIKSAVSGINFSIFFYGLQADTGKASSLRFFAGWRVGTDREGSLQKTNDWNARRRYAKAYVDEENDICLDMDLVTSKGVSRAQVADVIEVWSLVLGEFVNFMRSQAS